MAPRMPRMPRMLVLAGRYPAKTQLLLVMHRSQAPTLCIGELDAIYESIQASPGPDALRGTEWDPGPTALLPYRS